MKEDCPYCDNSGVYPRQVGAHEWNVEEGQCEWCHTNPNSKFNTTPKEIEFCPICDAPLNGWDYCQHCGEEILENNYDNS